MKIFSRKIITACSVISLVVSSCRYEEIPGTAILDSGGITFRLEKAGYDGNVSKSQDNSNGAYDRVIHHIFDSNGNVVANVKSYYDTSSGEIKAEGLHEGSYVLTVLGIEGNERADGVVIHDISHADDIVLDFPTTIDRPLSADYFYSRTPFTVMTVTGEDGKLHETADIPESIKQKRIISRVDFDLDFRNKYVANSVVSRKVIINNPVFYNTFSANGEYGGRMETDMMEIDLDKLSRCRFMPVVPDQEIKGEVQLRTVSYLSEETSLSYSFSIAETQANNIHQILTDVRHPDDRLATMYITEKALVKGDFSRILQDGESKEVYTDRSQRMFNTAEPLQVSVEEGGKLHIRFYSPKDLHRVLLKAKIESVSDEYFDLAYFEKIPAFTDYYEAVPLCEKNMMVRTESGKYIETGIMSAADLAEAQYKIDSDDGYWKKLQKIEHGWNIYWGLYGGDPDREDGGPSGNWMGIRPVHCRESVAFFLNFTYMIDMPEHEQILRENADILYDDNKEPVLVEEVLAKMRGNRTLQVGLVYTGNGVLGLGSGSVFGAYQGGWFNHYNDTYACSIMFHELGHVMGYGHASSFTYGPWAESLMNNFYVSNLGIMPVDSREYLSSSSNPHRYL